MLDSVDTHPAIIDVEKAGVKVRNVRTQIGALQDSDGPRLGDLGGSLNPRGFLPAANRCPRPRTEQAVERTRADPGSKPWFRRPC